MKVRNNDARVISLGGLFNLGPGVNEVSDALWLKATANMTPAVKGLFADKVLEVVEEPKAVVAGDVSVPRGEPATGEVKTGSGDLSGMKADDAIALVSDTFDRDTLAAWSKAESRKTVLAALADQLELTKP